MARMECKCGCVLSNSQAPNEVQLRVYTDKEWDEILSTDKIATWNFPLPKYDVWRCKSCGRIYVFQCGSDTPMMQYVLENQS